MLCLKTRPTFTEKHTSEYWSTIPYTRELLIVTHGNKSCSKQGVLWSTTHIYHTQTGNWAQTEHINIPPFWTEQIPHSLLNKPQNEVRKEHVQWMFHLSQSFFTLMIQFSPTAHVRIGGREWGGGWEVTRESRRALLSPFIICHNANHNNRTIINRSVTRPEEHTYWPGFKTTKNEEKKVAFGRSEKYERDNEVMTLSFSFHIASSSCPQLTVS